MGESTSAEVTRLQKRLQRERNARREAEQIAERTTRQLYDSLSAVQRLHEAQRQLTEKLERRMEERTAELAHELRNPLAPIRNAIGILRAKGPHLPELNWARDVIERQVEQMSRLVDDLVDVSRITRGKVDLRKQRVELSAVVSDALEASRPLVEKWGHELTVALPPEPLLLDADPTRLAQVLLNLLNNAAKYTDHGGRIWLTAERAGGQVVIRVKDTGVGIPADMLPRVFEMFTQVDRSLERSEGGLGIGLTLVQRLVELHGGSVEAHSPGPDQGSEFVVRLPIAEEIESLGRPAAASDDAVPAPHARRILVVDDNRDAADSLAMLLRIKGHEVRTAHDGLEAVGAAAAFEPDVVLLDIGLPKLNGYEAARRIRELPGGSSRLLIALTGWHQEEDLRRSREAGLDHHIAKPVEFAALQKLLAERHADEYLDVALRYAHVPVKQAVISPSALSLMYPPDGIPGYPREQFIDELLREHETEVRSRLKKGAHNVQIDFTEGRRAVKLDPSGELLHSFIDLNNLALLRFTDEERKRIGVHTCPGADRDSTHSGDVDYSELLPSLFELMVGNFYIALAGEPDRGRVLQIIRHHMKAGQRIFIGVVAPIDPRIKTPEEVRDRTLEAAKFIPIEQLGTTDDCGFSPFCDDTSTTRDTAFAKIRARVEGTALASAILGGG